MCCKGTWHGFVSSPLVLAKIMGKGVYRAKTPEIVVSELLYRVYWACRGVSDYYKVMPEKTKRIIPVEQLMEAEAIIVDEGRCRYVKGLLYCTPWVPFRIRFPTFPSLEVNFRKLAAW